ncbi:MAG: 6-bladed beta-propeller [Candidatus Aminicenantes bacterium]|nr:6-bladed beta-propeller [Candidatus Aminicenantes bacterium]
MKPTIRLIFLLSLVLIMWSAACGPKDKVIKPEYPATIEEIDGVRTVHNPDYPKEGTFRYDLVTELVLGGPEAEGDAILVRPIQFRFDSLGNIYIMDWREVTIKVFDAEGNYIRSVGKQGQGPGEFDTPAYFRIVDDFIYLLDSRHRKFSLLTLDGEYLKGFNIEGFSSAVDVAPDGTIYYGQMLNPEVELSEKMQKVKTSFSLYQTDTAGENRKILDEFRDRIQMKRVTQSSSGVIGGITSTSREAYTTSWFIGPVGEIYSGYNQDYEFEVRDAKWNALLRFGRDFTPLPHPDYSPERGHPEFYPAFSDWREFFDEKGNLWLEQYPIDDVEEHVFDVFSPDGIYLRKVIVPEVLFDVKGDTAYGFVRDEEDYVLFKRYKMVLVEGDN